jgi:hypothetical protein
MWVKRYIRFSGLRRPEAMHDDDEVVAFLTWLANRIVTLPDQLHIAWLRPSTSGHSCMVGI